MRLNRLLWQQSKYKCMGTVFAVLVAVAVVCFLASSFYQEGIAALDDYVLLAVICFLPYLFLYWIVYLMWRTELVVMGGSGFEALVNNKKIESRLFRSKIFLLAEIILPVFIISTLLYVLINGLGANVLNLIYVNLLCILALLSLYVFNFLWANHIRDGFRRNYAELMMSGLLVTIFVQSYWLLCLFGIITIVLILMGFFFIRKEYS